MTSISPAHMAVLVWLTGALAMFWLTWRRVEAIAERDCACYRPRMTWLSTAASATPGGYLAALAGLAACWPVLMVMIPLARWRHRNDPRCADCGTRLTPPRER